MVERSRAIEIRTGSRSRRTNKASKDRLVERCGSTWDNPLTHVYSFPNHGVSFVALNSGFGCGLEGSEYDRGKLTIPAEEILVAFQSVPKGHQILSLMHHTTADLNDAASRLIVPMIEEKAS